jgi:hypothetical protein
MSVTRRVSWARLRARVASPPNAGQKVAAAVRSIQSTTNYLDDFGIGIYHHTNEARVTFFKDDYTVELVFGAYATKRYIHRRITALLNSDLLPVTTARKHPRHSLSTSSRNLLKVVLALVLFVPAAILGRWAPGHRRVAGWLVHCAVTLLLPAHRDRYRDEFLAELDWLDAERKPMLGVAFGMLATAVTTRIALQAKELAASPTAKRLGRFEPLWIGLIAALSAFAAIAAGWAWRQDTPPNGTQLTLAGIAAFAAGSIAAWQTWKARPRGSRKSRRGSRTP